MAEPEVHVSSIEALAAIFVQRFGAAMRRALASRDRFSFVVPGGSVANAFLPRLLTEELPWQRCDVFWGDERAVPLSSGDSNAGAQLSMWRSSAGDATLYPMDADAPDLAVAAARYERTIVERLGPTPQFDFVLLGMGEDGHIASLFPGRTQLEETTRLVTYVDDSPKPPPRRVTLTLPLLAGARQLYVAAFGASKGEAVRSALSDSRSTLPVARLIRSAARATVLLDRDAAQPLSTARQSASDTSTRLS